jgi:hypothetical protein
VSNKMLKLALAVALIAVALGGAILLHQRHVTRTTYSPGYCLLPGGGSPSSCPPEDWQPGTPTVRRVHPAWEDPVALVITLCGLSLAVALVAPARGRSRQPAAQRSYRGVDASDRFPVP